MPALRNGKNFFAGRIIFPAQGILKPGGTLMSANRTDHSRQNGFQNPANGPEIPLGLGMALAQNVPAMNRFAAMPPEQQAQIVAQTRALRSKEEMRRFVDSLADAAPSQPTDTGIQ